MKKLVSKFILFTVLSTLIWSCEAVEENIQPQPEVQKGTAFTARYIVPLTTGRDNGETEIVDAAKAAITNVAELKPVMSQVVQAALEGEIPVYPDFNEDPESNPQTYLQRHYDKIAKFSRPIANGELEASFEMEFEGEAFEGYSKMKPTFIDLTFVDSQGEFPDKIMGRVWMKDLVEYKVKKGNSQLTLPQYLENGDFEHYVIGVTSVQDTFRIRTHADARTVQQKLDQGQLENLNPYQPI